MTTPHNNEHDHTPLTGPSRSEPSLFGPITQSEHRPDAAHAPTPEPARWGKPSTGPNRCSSSRRGPICGDPPARHNGPDTSKGAASSMREAAPVLRDRVLAFIASRGEYGATDDEGERALNLPAQTYTPRRGELVKLGRIAWTGDKRPTKRGRQARVWVAVDPMTSADAGHDGPRVPPRMAHAPATIGGGA